MSYSGVFKPTNSGSSWTQVNTGLANLYVEALAILPNYATDQTIFAGTWGAASSSRRTVATRGIS